MSLEEINVGLRRHRLSLQICQEYGMNIFLLPTLSAKFPKVQLLLHVPMLMMQLSLTEALGP